MCRVMGCSDSPFSREEVASFYVRQGALNPHASGMISVGSSAWIQKAPLQGEMFWRKHAQDIMERGDRADISLYHVRFATHGSPQHNANNHPIYKLSNKHLQVALVHNGVVDPHEWISGDGECDSEQLLLHWIEDGPEAWAKFTGYATVLLWEETTLYAYTSAGSLGYKVDGDGIKFDQTSRGNGWKQLPSNIIYAVNGRELEEVDEVRMQRVFAPRVSYSMSGSAKYFQAGLFDD